MGELGQVLPVVVVVVVVQHWQPETVALVPMVRAIQGEPVVVALVVVAKVVIPLRLPAVAQMALRPVAVEAAKAMEPQETREQVRLEWLHYLCPRRLYTTILITHTLLRFLQEYPPYRYRHGVAVVQAGHRVEIMLKAVAAVVRLHRAAIFRLLQDKPFL
jgi:hypothetical protein